MAVHAAQPPRPTPVWARIALAPLTAVVVLTGIWVAGGVVTDDFRASMGLTALWFAVVLAGAVVVWRRRPELRLPVSVVAVGTLVLVGGSLGLASARDVEVNETVATGPAVLQGALSGLAH